VFRARTGRPAGLEFHGGQECRRKSLKYFLSEILQIAVSG
jgi:hypothetical protein